MSADREQQGPGPPRRDAGMVRDEIVELRRRIDELERAIAALQLELRQFYEQESFPPAP